MSRPPIILLFIKAPVKGKVKSRLAASLGEETAAEIYRNFVLDIADTAGETGYPLGICHFPARMDHSALPWTRTPSLFMPQEGRDLGERMENAFRRSFLLGFERVVLIGSDIPDLPSLVLREAIDALAGNDTVIGPASDGGYYLIGFNERTFLPDIFHGIAWSTGTVFQETLALLHNAGLTVYQTPRWHDVDTEEDLSALVERNRGEAFDNSRTMTYLRTSGLISDRHRYVRRKEGQEK